MQIHRRGFLGLLGAVVAGTSAAAAQASYHTVDAATRVGRAVNVDLGTVRWPSLSIYHSLAGSSARWITTARPTLGQRVAVSFGGDALFVGTIVRITMQIDRHPVRPYWEVDAESDALIASRRYGVPIESWQVDDRRGRDGLLERRR
jgi:hypothetical protein